MTSIQAVKAREIPDSGGTPTVRPFVSLSDNATAATSTGAHEAVAVGDGDKTRYGGEGVLKAGANVPAAIGPALVGHDARDGRPVAGRP
jgi:enolase